MGPSGLLVAALGILVLGLTWWAADEGYTMQGESEQTGSELAGRIEARLQQSGTPGMEKVRLGVLLHAKKMETADALFKALKDQGQDDEYARLDYAKTKFPSGQSADGFRHLQELSVRYPNSPTILYELGMAHIRQGRGAEGVVLMKRVLEIDPFYARANYELANWSAARSEPDKAIEYARRALAVEDASSPLAEKALLLLDKLIPEKKP